MPVHFPSESGSPAETPRGRSNVRTSDSVRLGFLFSDANTGVSQDVTGLVAAVQLRLRVAFGLQALQRCSGLLNRRARGSTVATHQPSLEHSESEAAAPNHAVGRRARPATTRASARPAISPMWLSSDSSSFVNCRAHLPHESASLSIGSIFASVVKLLSSSASNGEFAGGNPAGCTNLRACG